MDLWAPAELYVFEKLLMQIEFYLLLKCDQNSS